MCVYAECNDACELEIINFNNQQEKIPTQKFSCFLFYVFKILYTFFIRGKFFSVYVHVTINQITFSIVIMMMKITIAKKIVN